MVWQLLQKFVYIIVYNRDFNSGALIYHAASKIVFEVVKLACESQCFFADQDDYGAKHLYLQLTVIASAY